MIFLSLKAEISLTFRKLSNNSHNSSFDFAQDRQLNTGNLRCEGLPLSGYKMNSIVF
jgi:hypothetical protein